MTIEWRPVQRHPIVHRNFPPGLAVGIFRLANEAEEFPRGRLKSVPRNFLPPVLWIAGKFLGIIFPGIFYQHPPREILQGPAAVGSFTGPAFAGTRDLLSSQTEVKSRWGREKRKGERESGCSLVSFFLMANGLMDRSKGFI